MTDQEDKDGFARFENADNTGMKTTQVDIGGNQIEIPEEAGVYMAGHIAS